MTLQKWMKRADVEDGAKPGTTRAETAELREARKRDPAAGAGERGPGRAAAYLSQANLPGKGSTRS